MAAEDVLEKKSKGRRRRGGEDAEAQEEKGLTSGKGRATPGRRKSGSDKKSSNALTRPFSGIATYFREVRDELDKVTWPTREETIRLTRIVLIVTIVASIVLGALGVFMSYLVRWGLDTPILFVAILLGAVAFSVVMMRRSGGSGSAY